jgi:hypothetical protein
VRSVCLMRGSDGTPSVLAHLVSLRIFTGTPVALLPRRRDL